MSEELYSKWSRWIQRIKNEQLRDLLINRHIFHQLRDCTEPYVGTHQGAVLSEWMVQNYIAFAATAIRRMSEPPRDKPNPKWQSISLVILLTNMAENDTILTRERFKGLYKDSPALRFADRDFNKITGSKDDSHVARACIEQDLEKIRTICAPVNELVNKVVAHTEEDRQKVVKYNFGQIDDAIDLLKSIFEKYLLLVDAVVCPVVPLDDIDVHEDLKKIWP